MERQYHGHCLCGAVKIHATPVSTDVGACHCGMCRHWGGPLLAINCGSNVLFDNAQNISVYASSEWAERGFCKTCGSHLFYRTKDRAFYEIPAGLFDDLLDAKMTQQLFIDEKPRYYTFADITQNMTEREIMTLFKESQTKG
jgi:hypothetical protein